MEAFFQDIEPNLAASIRKDVSEAELSEFIKSYEPKASDSKDDRLRALVVFLRTVAATQEITYGLQSTEWKHATQVLGLVQADLQDWPGATATWQSIVDADDQVSLDDHPQRDLASMFNLGLALDHMQKYPEAEAMFRRLLPMLAATPNLGKTSQQYVGSLSALMLAVGMQGRVEEARSLYSEHAQLISDYEEPEHTSHASSAKKILSQIEHDAREM